VMGKGGEILVFDMGAPVRIIDLAERMIRLSGKEPGRDIAIIITGLRPGEKRYEELLASAENTLPTHHPRILIGKTREVDAAFVRRGVDDLIAAAALQASEREVRIASTDKDFLQLVGERITVYATVKKLVIDAVNFTSVVCPRDANGESVVFPRERYLDYRVASGDASDDLPGIPGVGTLTAARLLAEAPLDAYLDAPERATAVLGRKNGRLDAALATGAAGATVQRNRQLMDLRLAAGHYSDLEPYARPGSWNEAAFRELVREMRITGMEIETTVATMARLAAAR